MTATNILFLHIPKTAGQSVHEYLVNVFGQEQVCPARVNAQLQQYEVAELQQYQVFSGHFDWKRLDFVADPKFTFTILRDPVERMVSFYLYLRREAQKLDAQALELPENRGKKAILSLTPDEYFADPGVPIRGFIDDHYDNFYTYYFAGRSYDARRSVLASLPSGLSQEEQASRVVELAAQNLERVDRVYSIEDWQERLSEDLWQLTGLEKAKSCLQGREFRINRGDGLDLEERLNEMKNLGATHLTFSILMKFVVLDRALLQDCCPLLASGLDKSFEILNKFQEGRTSRTSEKLSSSTENRETMSNTVQSLIEQAKSCQFQGDWQHSTEYLSKAIELQEDCWENHQLLGDALLHLKRWEEAISAYHRVLELKLDFDWTYHNLAIALNQLGKVEEADSLYQKLSECNPQFWETNKTDFSVQKQFGDYFFRQGQWENAAKAYCCASNINPNSIWSYINWGRALNQLGRWDEAESRFNQAILLNSNFAETYYYLAEMFVEHKVWDKAISAYRKATELKPDLITHYHELLNLHSETFEDLSVEDIPDRFDDEILSDTVSEQDTAFQSMEEQVDVRAIAFYLPQFHPIPENDLWWGKGFTEWTNVTKARPLFEGHYQPHLPADLGFYDLRLPEVREAQAELAKKYGIHGFCYYYYWFAGKRLLERPLDDMLASGKPDFPFCLCWANENWSRRWDGSEHDILIAQEHSPENNQAFAESVVPFLKDERYIRINGKPLLLVYRADIIPEIKEAVEIWRSVFEKSGVGPVYLSGALTFGLSTQDIVGLGFDSGVQFPPHGTSARIVNPYEVGATDFKGNLYEFKDVVTHSLAYQMPNEKLFLGAMTAWDNSARKGKSANIFLNSSPELYELWLRGIIEKTKEKYEGDERIVFINAWNEWAEGTHLEPDKKHGHAHLLATSHALQGDHNLVTALGLLRYLRIEGEAHLCNLVDGLKMRNEALNTSLEYMIQLTQKMKLKHFTVSSIIHESASDLLTGYIESPATEQDFGEEDTLMISGWVLSKQSKPERVELLSNNRVISIAPVNRSRTDVFQHYKEFNSENSGFYLMYEVSKISDCRLDVNVVCEDGSSLKLGSINFNVTQEPLLLPAKIKKEVEWANLQVDYTNELFAKLKVFPRLKECNYLLDELEYILLSKRQVLQALQGHISKGSFGDLF